MLCLFFFHFVGRNVSKLDCTVRKCAGLQASVAMQTKAMLPSKAWLDQNQSSPMLYTMYHLGPGYGLIPSCPRCIVGIVVLCQVMLQHMILDDVSVMFFRFLYADVFSSTSFNRRSP